MKIVLVLFAMSFTTAARAHSASDAYLNLQAAVGGKSTEPALQGQWDLALRDLDFVLHLDDNGDGHITWAEVRRHQSQIERYAYAKLHFGSKDAPCKIEPGRQLIDDHADGAYAALFFTVVCTRPVQTLVMKYDLFFAVDPSHRGIFVLHAGENVATAVLSPQNSTINLRLD